LHAIRSRDSFAYPRTCEEEWVYILSGHGIAKSTASNTRSGPAIHGLPAPSVASAQEPRQRGLVYLMGGEDQPVDVIITAAGQALRAHRPPQGTEF
jgi:uncharacterized cupin superfamily protein